MGHVRTFPIAAIIARGSIKDQDVQRLQRLFDSDGAVGEAEADAIFRLNDACHVQDPAWPVFFVDAITDYIVNQRVPEGYVTAAKADWLKARLAPDGRVTTKTGIELLIQVIDRARWSPIGLTRLALEQVLAAVATGEGPLRADQTACAGTILGTEVDLLRRILYAAGTDGHVALTRAETDVLLAINHAVAEAEPNPAWTDLFVMAVTNVVMAASGHTIASRERALAPSARLDAPDRNSAPATVLLTMLTSRQKDVAEGYWMQTPEERALAKLERQRIEIITHEPIEDADAAWLAEALGRDGSASAVAAALAALFKRAGQTGFPGLANELQKMSA